MNSKIEDSSLSKATFHSRLKTFQNILRLIEERSPHTVAEIIVACEEGGSIHQWKFNPLVTLIMENNEKGLEVFQHLRDPIRHRLMAQGYGLSGQVEKIDSLVIHEPKYGDYYSAGTGESISDFAAYGCAIRGDEKKVEELLARGVKKPLVIIAYFIGGHFDIGKKLLTDEDDLTAAIQGCAFGGHEEELKNLKLHFLPTFVFPEAVFMSIATQWSALSGNAELINKLVDNYNQIEKNQDEQQRFAENLLNSLKRSKFLNYREDALRFLTMIDNHYLKVLIHQEIYQTNCAIISPVARKYHQEEARQKFNFCQETPSSLRKFIDESKLSFSIASVLRTKGVRAWLLEGPNSSFIPELFWQVTTFLTGLSLTEAQLLLQAVHESLYKMICSDLKPEGYTKEDTLLEKCYFVTTSTATLASKFRWFIASEPDIEKQIGKAKERMESRISKVMSISTSK